MNGLKDEEVLLFLVVAEDDMNLKRRWVHDIAKERLLCGEYYILMAQQRKDKRDTTSYFCILCNGGHMNKVVMDQTRHRCNNTSPLTELSIQ